MIIPKKKISKEFSRSQKQVEEINIDEVNDVGVLEDKICSLNESGIDDPLQLNPV